MNDRCDWVRAHLERLLDGELPDSERAVVEAHCATCAACRALLESLRAADQAVRAGADVSAGAGASTTAAGDEAGRPAAVDAPGAAGDDEAFRRRWARFQGDFDLAALDRQRAAEMQADTGTPMTGEDVAAAPMPNAEVGASSLPARLRAVLAGWFAPRPAWRWASVAGGAVVVAVITTALIGRHPEVRHDAGVFTQAEPAHPEGKLKLAPAEAPAQAPAQAPPATGGAPDAAPSVTSAAPPAAAHPAPATSVPVAPADARAKGLRATRDEVQTEEIADAAARVEERALSVELAPALPPAPQSEQTSGPTWGGLVRLGPDRQGLQPGASDTKSTVAEYRAPADPEPPERGEMLARLTSLASDLDIAPPADLDHADGEDVAALLAAVERALDRRVSRPHPQQALASGSEVTEAGAGNRADPWVVTGDGWFDLLRAQTGLDARRLEDSSEPRHAARGGGSSHQTALAADSPAHGRVAAADSLVARALGAYERALALEAEIGSDAGTVPAYVMRRVEVLRGWIRGIAPPAPAVPAPAQRGR